MPNYQKITIIGHLGTDPKLKSVGDSEVCNFSLAWNPYSKDGDAPPVWFNIAVWNKQADACSRYLSKGRAVLVEGELNPREYEDKDGYIQTSMDVRAFNVIFLGGKDGDEGGGSGGKSGGGKRRKAREPGQDDDEKIPF